MAKHVPKIPVEMIDTWRSCDHIAEDGTIIRGMAGRVLFYDDNKQTMPIKVDGDVTVFVFDAHEQEPEHAKPMKVFRFRADTLEQYYSHQKPLGHGYDFFLPMDVLGQDEKPLHIITRFDNSLDGMFLVARPVNSMLAGRIPTEHIPVEYWQTAGQHSTIQQVSHFSEQQADGDPKPNSVQHTENRRVSTIPLNSSMIRRLKESQGE